MNPNFIKELVTIASDLDVEGAFGFADEIEGLLVEAAKKKEKRPDTSFIFGPDHPKVKDNKGHYPIPDAAHGRNAISRVNQMSKAPPWWKGSKEELHNAVLRAVKKKFPKIEISPAGKKPGKG